MDNVTKEQRPSETDGYCDDCDELGWLPNDEARDENDRVYKPCPWCNVEGRRIEYPG